MEITLRGLWTLIHGMGFGPLYLLASSGALMELYRVTAWYRATPPPGAVGLSLFPQRLLLSNLTTIGWHSLGMEWKEHVAWFAPISIAMAAFVFIRYGRDLVHHK